MSRPLLCLCMIVRNEAASIRKTLESAKPFVDVFMIMDTGSDDGTQQIITDTMQGTPGLLFSGAFIDYATARNEVLRHCALSHKPPIYTLMLSADEVLVDGAALREALIERVEATGGAYAITMQNGPQEWAYTRVLRVDAGWYYTGVIHEQPVAPDGGTVDAPVIPGRVVFTESDIGRKQRRLKEVDLPLLTKIAEDETKSYDDRARAMYYLGDTHAMIAGDCPKVDGKYDDRSAWLTHNMQAMSYYWRYARIAEDPKNSAHDHEKAMRGYFFYYHIADKIGFWHPSELFQRLEILCEAAPTFAMAWFMKADIASRIDVRKGLMHALEAAKVARLERENPAPHVVIDTRIEWLCLRIASQCARMMQSHSQARDLARKGIEAGGPKEAFAELL
jgi:glycosyltransferase involved in cell wall biosynthesis